MVRRLLAALVLMGTAAAANPVSAAEVTVYTTREPGLLKPLLEAPAVWQFAVVTACAQILGQALPGVPAWQAGPESKWPGLAYVVFPGNVGGPDAIRQLVASLIA